MFDEDVLQPAHSWVQPSDPDDDDQPDPRRDSDVTPDPVRNPEGRTLTG
jgi:hypothetical protein